MPFQAREEGLLGFYFVVTNAAGVSGSPPESGTEPQQWAMVDYSPPILQLHAAEHDPDSSTDPIVRIRWTAIDQHLPTRPVGLWYRSVPAGNWVAIASDVANTGRYDWRVPDDVPDSIVVHITVQDRAGNRVQATSPAIEMNRSPTPTGPGAPRAARSESGFGTESALRLPPEPASSGTLDPVTRARMQALAARGAWHAARGEQRLAIARYRDALQLDAGHTESLLGVADSLYSVGDLSPSIEAYHLLLTRDPTNRVGLERLARALVAQRDYPAAARQLEILLRHNPGDVMAWLELGDVALYQGDQVAAAEHYRRAATLDPQAAEVIAMARARLANLNGIAERARNIATGP